MFLRLEMSLQANVLLLPLTHLLGRARADYEPEPARTSLIWWLGFQTSRKCPKLVEI